MIVCNYTRNIGGITNMVTLAEIDNNKKYTITNISCEKATKERLGDMGIIEGSEISCVHIGYGGSPRAFMVKGMMVAIRTADCSLISVKEVE